MAVKNVRHRRGLRLGHEVVRVTFDGRVIEGLEGDTAASALLANGIRLVARSVKYRRRRGVFSAGPEEPNALLTVGVEPHVIPNIPAPRLMLRAGLQIRSQNRWPRLDLDAGALLRLGGSLYGAGFYYKTFMWPSWRFYEGMIRRLAGLGAAPRASDLPPAARQHMECDVAIAGGGPAGLAAALAAARAGARVVLCEREPACGGELEFEAGEIEGRPALSWVDETLCELHERSVRVLTQTAVVAAAGGLVVAHCEPGGLPGRDTLYRLSARAFVTATGAIERPIAFVDNDLPGVMLLGAAERYLARYGVHVGRNLLLFGSHDRLYAAAARFMAAGMPVGTVVDTRAECATVERSELQRAGVECLLGYAVLAAEGRKVVTAAHIAPVTRPADVRRVSCDALLVSGGWSSQQHSSSNDHHGARPWRTSCGAANGRLPLASVLTDAYEVGAQVAPGRGSISMAPRGRGDAAPDAVPFWRSPGSRTDEKRQFVDLQNDVTVADLRQSIDEGLRDIEHVKRYTTLGIGTEQGRTSGALGAAIVAELSGDATDVVRASRARPPYEPVTLSALSGRRRGDGLRPTRLTSLHECHLEQGAVMEPAALWMRPRYYRENGGDAFTAGVAEAARVRTIGGVFDGSTLGKIEIAGPDAAAFLDRIYLNPVSTLAIGCSKYVVLLREDGMVLDDGLALRIAETRFLVTCSTGHTDNVLSHFEFWRDTEWSARAVTVSDVTEAWGVIVIAGPKSRDTLCAALDAQSATPLRTMPHMAFCRLHWRACPVRVLRASFSGELAFEVHCQPEVASALWRELIKAGLPPYGLEAVDILRIEKGYLSAAEFNGQTTPWDLGLERLMNLGNVCVGRNLLDRKGLHETTRPRLVGLHSVRSKAKLRPGAQITAADSPEHGRGHVTSTAFSPALGKWIGLALVARDLAIDGAQLLARDPLRGGDVHVRVVPPVHFDPAGERMKA